MVVLCIAVLAYLFLLAESSEPFAASQPIGLSPLNELEWTGKTRLISSDIEVGESTVTLHYGDRRLTTAAGSAVAELDESVLTDLGDPGSARGYVFRVTCRPASAEADLGLENCRSGLHTLRPTDDADDYEAYQAWGGGPMVGTLDAPRELCREVLFRDKPVLTLFVQRDRGSVIYSNFKFELLTNLTECDDS